MATAEDSKTVKRAERSLLIVMAAVVAVVAIIAIIGFLALPYAYPANCPDAWSNSMSRKVIPSMPATHWCASIHR